MQCAKVYVKIYANIIIETVNVFLCKEQSIDIMHLYCLFNVYNRDTKVTFKPINDLPDYVI
jgi:hypothetical protein